ncbi:hypothetical protein ONE63_011467 [Megalurothrips usitatus]|uniref:Endonuclease/exonuclease/phosphatase domain-containing protein n=1 Tax=Megalurothrips usitatus TaxID=439358 RepID=A0AAV7X5M1_9NEOP|nr:hypothetical protein ONE63_011467 [Megalurothrips usitatus]
MPEIRTRDTVATLREVPEGPDALFMAVLLAATPDDEGALQLRAAALRRAMAAYMQARMEVYREDLVAYADAHLDQRGQDLNEVERARLALQALAEPGRTAGPECLDALAAVYGRSLKVLRPGHLLTWHRPGQESEDFPPLVIAQRFREDVEEAGVLDLAHFDAVQEERPWLEPVQQEQPPEGQPREGAPVGITALPDAHPRALRTDSTHSPCISQATPSTPPPPGTSHPSAFRFATWNVRGCATQEKREQVERALLAEDVLVAALQETNLPPHTMHTDNFLWIVEHATQAGRRRGGAILVRRNHPDVQLIARAAPAMDIMVAELHVCGMEFFVVNCHAPPATNPRQGAVFNSLAAVVGAIPPTHWRVLMGDLNARVGRDQLGDGEPQRPRILGNRLLHEVTDQAGEDLVSIATLNLLPIQTSLGKAENCTVTRQQGPQESQLDHVLMDYPRLRRIRASFRDEKKSDHKMLVVTMDRPNSFPPPWPRLQDAIITAANAVLRKTASPITPNREIANRAKGRVLRLVQRLPGDEDAREALRRASAAQQRAKRFHQIAKNSAFTAALERTPPAQRMAELPNVRTQQIPSKESHAFSRGFVLRRFPRLCERFFSACGD